MTAEIVTSPHMESSQFDPHQLVADRPDLQRFQERSHGLLRWQEGHQNPYFAAFITLPFATEVGVASGMLPLSEEEPIFDDRELITASLERLTDGLFEMANMTIPWVGPFSREALGSARKIKLFSPSQHDQINISRRFYAHKPYSDIIIELAQTAFNAARDRRMGRVSYDSSISLEVADTEKGTGVVGAIHVLRHRWLALTGESGRYLSFDARHKPVVSVRGLRVPLFRGNLQESMKVQRSILEELGVAEILDFPRDRAYPEIPPTDQ